MSPRSTTAGGRVASTSATRRLRARAHGIPVPCLPMRGGILANRLSGCSLTVAWLIKGQQFALPRRGTRADGRISCTVVRRTIPQRYNPIFSGTCTGTPGTGIAQSPLCTFKNTGSENTRRLNKMEPSLAPVRDRIIGCRKHWV